ncbi:hypothetical protein CXB51_001018 [Gossypium anomalum]|uniref:Uncharacterized protein n=1 Tax=Gossypium anomalum TaxID=47600 RepID=A0A8J5ZRJ3_9ROSI|nr:hypothetical protein CXB51_001018 [Gossypium anomalum]
MRVKRCVLACAILMNRCVWRVKEVVKLQCELSQWAVKLETQLKEFKDDFKGVLRSELHNLFEQYLENLTPAASNPVAQVKGKRILGGLPLGFPLKEPLEAPFGFQAKESMATHSSLEIGSTSKIYEGGSLSSSSTLRHKDF